MTDRPVPTTREELIEALVVERYAPGRLPAPEPARVDRDRDGRRRGHLVVLDGGRAA